MFHLKFPVNSSIKPISKFIDGVCQLLNGTNPVDRGKEVYPLFLVRSSGKFPPATKEDVIDKGMCQYDKGGTKEVREGRMTGSGVRYLILSRTKQ